MLNKHIKPIYWQLLTKIKNNKSYRPQHVVNTLIRPFSDNDLPKYHDELMIGPPDFIGVGIPKAGTSWWYKLLIEHPSILEHLLYSEQSATSKELHYFIHYTNKEYNKDHIETYYKVFPRKKGQICGELTTRYMSHPGCIELIKKTAPDTKIFVILRNPIYRTLSHINHTLVKRGKRFNLQDDNAKLFKLYSVFSEAYIYSFYSDPIKRIYDLFDKSNVLILQYEKCKLNTIEEIAKTYRFLGVDDAFVPSSIRTPVNRFDYVTDKPSKEMIQYLRNYFTEDVNRTVELCPEIDLTLWEEFCDDYELF